MKGILWKWTNYWMGWQPRWFILEDGVMSYYKSEEEVCQGCKGSVSVSACDINVHSTDNLRLDIVIPGEQHIYVRAGSTPERQQWLVALGTSKSQGDFRARKTSGTGTTTTNILVAPSQQEFPLILNGTFFKIENADLKSGKVSAICVICEPTTSTDSSSSNTYKTRKLIDGSIRPTCNLTSHLMVAVIIIDYSKTSPDAIKTKKSELRLYCDLLMQQVHSIKEAVTSETGPNIQKLDECTSLLSATCDTFISTLDDVLKISNASSPYTPSPSQPVHLVSNQNSVKSHSNGNKLRKDSSDF